MVRKWMCIALTLMPLAACHGSEGGEKASLPPPGQAAAKEPATAAVTTADQAPAGALEPVAASSGASPAAAGGAGAPEPTAATLGLSPSAAGGAGSPEPTAAIGGLSPAAGKTTEPASPAAAAYRLTGAVSAVRRSQVGFRVGGVIASVTAKPGNVFKKGDVLATLDDRDFILRADLAKAKLEGARVQLENAAKEYKREQQLQKENASTASGLDRMRLAFDEARVNVKLAELDLRSAEDALRDTKLTAQYDCVVTQQFKYEGEQVATMQPMSVLEIYDVASPEVDLSAPERLMSQVRIGSKLHVTIPSAAYSGTSQVVRVVPVVSDKTRSFTVTVRLETDMKIAPGAYAEATLD